MWAHVTANEHDPQQQGRIQVEFEWEHLDPQASSERAWLHLVTPYGGGHAGGKKASAYSGFYSVPEVGERVLVEFLGEWDSEAVILGTVRHTSQKAPLNPKDTKRWATPEGNEIAMTSRGGSHVVRMRNQNDLVFEAQKTAGGGHHASFMSGGSEDNSIHFSVNEDDTRLEIRAGKDTVLFTQNNMLIQATRHLHIQAESITLHATGAGGVKIEAQTDDISLNAVNKNIQAQGKGVVTVQSQNSLVNIQSATGMTLRTGGELFEQAGKIHLNDGSVPPNVPDLPAPQPSPIAPSK